MTRTFMIVMASAPPAHSAFTTAWTSCWCTTRSSGRPAGRVPSGRRGASLSRTVGPAPGQQRGGGPAQYPPPGGRSGCVLHHAPFSAPRVGLTTLAREHYSGRAGVVFRADPSGERRAQVSRTQEEGLHTAGRGPTDGDGDGQAKGEHPGWAGD